MKENTWVDIGSILSIMLNVVNIEIMAQISEHSMQ